MRLRPIVAIDFDGPILAFHEEIARRFGVSLDNFSAEYSALSPEQRAQVDHDLPTIPFQEGALRNLSDLERNFRPVILTSRPPSQISQLYQRVLRHLYEPFVFCSEEKGKVCRSIGARWLIDDQPQYLAQCSAPTEPLAFARPWNRDFRGPRGDWLYLVWYLENHR